MAAQATKFSAHVLQLVFCMFFRSHPSEGAKALRNARCQILLSVLVLALTGKLLDAFRGPSKTTFVGGGVVVV